MGCSFYYTAMNLQYVTDAVLSTFKMMTITNNMGPTVYIYVYTYVHTPVRLVWVKYVCLCVSLSENQEV